MLNPGEQILFTRQRHEAKRAGLHWDYRLVAGDKAYSWATKKELPGPGKAIVFFEQPVHTAHYALSERVEIPDGQYGAGSAFLDMCQKAFVSEGSTPTKLTLKISDGTVFNLVKLPENSKYGKKSWLLVNNSQMNTSKNKYLSKINGQ